MAVVVGANDIVNPATVSDMSSPIYGMPAVEVWQCKKVVVLKRSMATGYSGVDNPLFSLENVRMLFGDAKHSVDTVYNFLEERKDQIGKEIGFSGSPRDEEGGVGAASRPREYPPPLRTIGVIRERASKETRVALAPSNLAKLREMQFDVVMEAGAGTGSG